MRNIYAIQRVSGGEIKIGIANDVDKRLRALQTSHSEPLYVLLSFEGGSAMEKALHAHLKDHRAQGEWFYDNEHTRGALRLAQEGLLWEPDDWVKHASLLRKNGLSYRQLEELFGYSREHIRKSLRPSRKGRSLQPRSCRLPLPGTAEYENMTGIDKAIEIAGSQSALADMLGCSQQAVSKMKRHGYAPPARADQIAAVMKIERTALIDPALRAAVLGQ